MRVTGKKIMKNTHLVALLVVSSLLVSACGARSEEGSGSGQPVFNANGDLISGGDGSIPRLGTPDATDELKLTVISDVNSIATGGSDIATITALITDANNNAVAETELTFSSTGGVLQGISPMTNENGEANATLKLPQDFQNQDILITVSAGDFKSDVKVTASGSTLEVTGPDNLVAGDSAELVARLTAGNGEPIANHPVAVISAAGNPISPGELITDADGRVEILVGSQNSSDTVQLSALNNTVSASHVFAVVDDLLSFSDIEDGDELIVGTDSLVRVQWIAQNQPVANQLLNFAITAGIVSTPVTAMTDSEGYASARVSSNSAGPAKITVEAADGGSPKTDIDIEFVATAPETVIIDASSSFVNINETSTVTALVQDELGNPVKNSEVSFAGIDLKGGQLNPASAVTNSAGIASVTFTAGDRATETDEIIVNASVKGLDITDSMALTVFKRALNVTLGSANLISVKPLATQYAMPIVVQVADGAGRPLENATVSVSVRPLSYYKGQMELEDDAGRNLTEVQALGDAIGEDFVFTPKVWVYRADVVECPTEDLDGDRFLDTLSFPSEDINNNGSLDPQDPASLAAVEGDYATLSGGSLRTDANGSGFFELLYPATNAGWSTVEIIARAEALGTEAVDVYRARLSLLTSEVLDVENPPDNALSPYGQNVNANVIGQVNLRGQTYIVREACTNTN
ncbi:MAG: Ig-like domain-containing protein [Granulosicoccus sp.]